ncbi:MAG: 50S ribosomal protein L13 [Gammaproteobacteria bacterium]|jgi:large subunit ribosomal protein L13|nr:50S ribosomal protein L13 [Gammaproteobacteria bacterium]|tara:strand:+ start:845 stop:1273 length:429 start_codon:yes stop_codon:yes gene_type:complete
MKTKSYKNTDLDKKWLLLDARDETLGRLSSKIASILMGKNKAQYTPHNDLGDYVVVVNAEKIRVTGNKDIQKKYYKHTGYPGGLKSSTFSEIIEKNPENVILKAVKGMLPKNKLSNSMISKLKVYEGDNHPHAGQNPIKIEL